MKEIGIDHCLKSFNRIVTNASTISKKKQNLPPTIMMMMNSPEGSKKEGGEEGKELNRMTSISKMAKNRMMMNLHGGGGGGGKSNQNLLNPLFFSASNKNMKSLISNDPNQMFGQIDIRVEDPFKDSFLKKEELNDLKLLSSILIKLNQLSFLSDYKEKRSKFLLQFTEFLKHRIFFFFMKNIIFTFLNIIIIKKKKKRNGEIRREKKSGRTKKDDRKADRKDGVRKENKHEDHRRGRKGRGDDRGGVSTNNKKLFRVHKRKNEKREKFV